MKKKPAAPGKTRRCLTASHPCCRVIAVQDNKYKQKIKNQEKFPKPNHLKNTDIQLWYSLVFCLLSSVYPQYTAADLSCKITRTGDEADIRKSKRYKRTQKQIHI